MKRLLFCVLLLVACDPPSAPRRMAAYPFDNGGGDVFHWPVTHLPVRFFADTRGPIPKITGRSFRMWEAQFLYGEYRAQESDSAQADVIITYTGTVPPDVPPDSGPPVVACGGFTRFVLDSATNTIDSAIVISVQRFAVTATDRQVVACLRRVIAHEIGHSLGLLQHSPDPMDVMASQPIVDRASGRDRVTAEILYHTVPTIGPPPR